MRLKNILTMITFAATATMAAQSPLPSGLDKNNMNLSAKTRNRLFRIRRRRMDESPSPYGRICPLRPV